MRVERQYWEKAGKVPTLAPAQPEKPAFIASAFRGRMQPEDQAHMARAILFLSDENAEMKARIKALELAFAELRGDR